MSSPEAVATELKPSRGLIIGGIVAALVAVGLVAAGLASRAMSATELKTWTEDQAEPTVHAALPSTASNASALDLPGRLEAYMRAPIYARVPGYLKSWHFDIGAKVRAGDLLAEIETPDLDQQLLQARADLVSAQANASLAQTTAARWTNLLGSDSVSKQEVDEKVGDYSTKAALVNAAQANVNHILATKSFTRIVAPFSGTVTARETDVGALINAGSGGGPELFVVSDITKLRVYVSVPQNYVPSVPAGTKATITVPEHPDKHYAATVESSAESVVAASGTTLMQLLVDNPRGELMPGGYAEVRLALAGSAKTLTVPASALIFNSDGLSVATVQEGIVQVKAVTVTRDLGKVLEIGSGLATTDQIIDSPPDGIASGARVKVANEHS